MSSGAAHQDARRVSNKYYNSGLREVKMPGVEIDVLQDLYMPHEEIQI